MSRTLLLYTVDNALTQQVRRACDSLDAVLQEWPGNDADIDSTIRQYRPDAMIVDTEHDEGFRLFERVYPDWPRLPVVLIAARADSELAIEAMKHGAIDYLLKPFEHTDLVARIDNALRIGHDMAVPTLYDDQNRDVPADRIIGQSPAMHEVFKLIGLVAPRDVNVLITGESGTGKELVAKALYHHSVRKDRAFLAVNCAAIPETLLESELFGHEKGAFTGADNRRIGKFEQCHRGTLFLDEIGDLPLSTQAKLLRVLQDGTFQRLGGVETIHCDVRIISATNQDLEQMITERRFREDLYYRLKVATIHLPPLREREVDAVLLAHYLVRQFNPHMGTNIRTFAPDVLPALLKYPWPGNVRELENAIKSSLLVARGTVFQLEFLPEKIRLNRPIAPAIPSPATDSMPRQQAGGVLHLPNGNATSDTDIPYNGNRQAAKPADPAGAVYHAARQMAAGTQFHGHIHDMIVQTAEKEAIRACLQQADGRIATAARMLGITRTTLRKKIDQLGLTVHTSVADSPDTAQSG